MNRILLPALIIGIVLSLAGIWTTLAASPTNPAEYDLNHSGAVTIGDTILELNHIGQSAVKDAPYDFDENGGVNIQDTTILNNHIGNIVPVKWAGVNFWAYSGEPGTTDSTCNMGGARSLRTAALAPKAQVLRIAAYQGYAEHNGARDWSQLDSAFRDLAWNNMQGVVVLGNNWGLDSSGNTQCDGPNPQHDKGCDWYDTGYKQQTFYGQTHVQSYRDYVQAAVTRYSASPAIRIWEVMNEPRGYGCTTAVMHSFFTDIVGVIAAADPWTPISLGGNGDGWDFTAENSIAGVKATTFHDYTEPGNPVPSWVQGKIDQAKALGKPIYDGEQSVDCSADGYGCGSPCNEQTMANAMLAKGQGEFAAGVTGYLGWAFNYTASLGSCGRDFGPASPRLDLIHLLVP